MSEFFYAAHGRICLRVAQEAEYYSSSSYAFVRDPSTARAKNARRTAVNVYSSELKSREKEKNEHFFCAFFTKNTRGGAKDGV
jgi:hypothetical protein